MTCFPSLSRALRVFLRKWPPATLDSEPPEALWPETKGQAASLARVRGHPLHGAGGHGAHSRGSRAQASGEASDGRGSAPERRDCSQHCSQAAGQGASHADSCGMSAQRGDCNRWPWTMCPLLRIRRLEGSSPSERATVTAGQSLPLRVEPGPESWSWPAVSHYVPGPGQAAGTGTPTAPNTPTLVAWLRCAK